MVLLYMKVVYLITKDDVGGAQKYVNDLLENLDRNQFEAKIIHGGKKGARFLSNRLRPHFLFINDWAALIELFFTFHKERPDIVHLNSSKAGVIGALAAFLYNFSNKLTANNLKLKTVFTAHGWVFNPDNDLSLLRKKFYILLHKIAARFQDKIINVSEYDRKLAIQCGIADQKKLVTVYNGIDHHKINFLDKRTARKVLEKIIASAAPTKAGIQNRSQFEPRMTDSDIWIGSVGRLVTEKNYEALVEAAALIANPRIKFFIIGSGLQKKRIQSLIANRGLQNRFFVIENLSPAAPYLKAFDIFTLSSIKEGMPYTLLEAMAAELPIVTTRIGGMTEIIDPPGGPKRGLAMPAREPEELARAIKYLMDHFKEAEKMSKEARRFLKEKLSLEAVLEKIRKIYEDLN